MDDLLRSLLHTPRGTGLVVIAAVLVVEAGFLAGMLLPGSTAALAAGWLSVNRGLPLALVIAVVTASTVVGAHLSWWRGRHTAAPAKVKGRLRRLLGRVFAGLRQHPLVVVAVAQCVAGTRTLTPRAAAAAGVSYRRFTVAQLAGATAWASVMVVSGTTAASLVPPLDPDLYAVVPLVVGLLVAAVLAVKLVRRRRAALATPAPVAAGA
ncbi:hypothetical protein TEK04_14440 [Klenkia sp. LSe6-5]|uniref:Membrane protein DedA, SNARE-associated domain n=1 Tax=Klenkia sesuvii TaxID=3103137 RepID=A0ABU8DWB9_9ACTN